MATDTTFLQSSIQVDDQTIKKDGDGKIYTVFPEEISEHECEIIELQANASVTPFDHDTLISDTFSDADGYKNSVDTGNTTDTYDSTNKKYYRSTDSINPIKGAVTDSGALTSTNFTTTFNAKKKGVVTKIEYYLSSSGTTTTTFTIKNSLAETIYTKSVSEGGTGGLKTLNIIPDEFTKPINASENFTIQFQSTNMPFTYQNTGAIDNDNFSMANGQSTLRFSDKGVTYSEVSYTTKKIVINLPIITGTVTHTELVCKSPDRETGDNITYKLKNATQSDDDLAINTKHELINLTSNPTGIEINTIPRSSSPTFKIPSVKSYCLKLWKA